MEGVEEWRSEGRERKREKEGKREEGRGSERGEKGKREEGGEKSGRDGWMGMDGCKGRVVGGRERCRAGPAKGLAGGTESSRGVRGGVGRGVMDPE